MSDYNLIQIGDTYLTDSGEVDGMPCRVDVSGLDALQFDFTGAQVLSANGNPYSFIVENSGAGLPIEIRPFAVMKDVFDDIRAEIQAAVDGDTAIVIKISGATGTFDLDCIPALPKPIEFPGTFSDERIDNVVFRFLVTAVNEPEEED